MVTLSILSDSIASVCVDGQKNDFDSNREIVKFESDKQIVKIESHRNRV